MQKTNNNTNNIKIITLSTIQLQLIQTQNIYPILYFPWLASDFNGFTSTKIVFYATIFDTPFDIIIFANNIPIANMNVNTSNVYTLNFVPLNTNFLLTISVLKGIGINDPLINGITLHYI